MEIDYLRFATFHADAQHDGHFSLLKFTTNWKAVFGPQENPPLKWYIAGDGHKTASEAIRAALEVEGWDMDEQQRIYEEYVRKSNWLTNKEG